MTIFSEVMVILVVRNEHVLGNTLASLFKTVEAMAPKTPIFLRQICKTSETLTVVRTAYLADTRREG